MREKRGFDDLAALVYVNVGTNRMLLAAAALAALPTDANALDDRLPAQFVGDWCVAEHTANHLSRLPFLELFSFSFSRMG